MYNDIRRLPKTYPTLATPIFTVQQPIQGLKPPQIAKLTSILNAEAQKLKGTESVFQVSERAFPILPLFVTRVLRDGDESTRSLLVVHGSPSRTFLHFRNVIHRIRTRAAGSPTSIARRSNSRLTPRSSAR